MHISDLRKKFKNKWVLAEVVKEGKFQKLLDVKPIKVSDERDEIYKELAKVKKGSHVATLYTGRVPPKGMTFTFHVNISLRP